MAHTDDLYYLSLNEKENILKSSLIDNFCQFTEGVWKWCLDCLQQEGFIPPVSAEIYLDLRARRELEIEIEDSASGGMSCLKC